MHTATESKFVCYIDLFKGNEQMRESMESIKRMLFGVAGDVADDVVETGSCFILLNFLFVLHNGAIFFVFEHG